jgi:hypothetical protein
MKRGTEYAVGGCKTPHEWLHTELEFGGDGPNVDGEAGGEETETDTSSSPVNFEEDKPRNINGIPADGAVAYRQGIMTADCPFEEASDEAEAWYTAWDEAADAAVDAEEDDAKSGSVVNAKYRARYAEQGHPTHCGDALAVLLNNHCAGTSATNLELFEHICGLNGVDTSKYNRTSRGWQGRIRMTGRNMLAKKVYANGGKVVMPETLGGEVQMPADWMSAQRFKNVKAA